MTKRGRRRITQPHNPTPLAAIEAKHGQLASGFSKRGDRLSQLLSRIIQDQLEGGYLVTKSALTPEEHAELIKLAPEAHKGFQTELSEAIAKLRDLLRTSDPLHTAATVQSINLFTPWGAYFEPTHEGSEAKVELVSGLLATQPLAETLEPPTASQMQAIFDELDHIVEVGFLLNLARDPEEDPDIARLKFGGAMRWMTVRGSSFAGHGRDLALALYRPHNDWLLTTFGFTIEDVLQVGDAVVGLMNAKMNALGRTGEAEANQVLSQAPKGDPNAEAKGMMAFLGAMEAGIRGAMTVTAAEIGATRKSPPIARVQAVLDELSVSAGSLSSDRYTGLFDESPLRTKPFLELNGDHLLTVPGALERDSPALLEARLLAGKAGFSQRRAKTLDQLAVGYLADLLPGAVTQTNLFYEGAELDGLVLFDDVALVVEGKGTPISVQGQRGDIRRLRSDIEAAVEDAWKQGARARAYILRAGDAVFTDETGVELVRVPSGSVSTVFIVNPTLHELAGHASQLGRLRSLGLFPDQELPWSVYINDLRVISETCDNAAVFLHYLVWRNRLPLGSDVEVSDEIDLWASYLLCERFGMLHEGGQVMIANSSTDFDAYYDGLAGRAPKAKKPRKFLPEPLRSYVDRLATERPEGWREAAGACLDLSIPELAAISTKFAEVAREAATQSKRVALEFGRIALVGIGQADDPRDAARGLMQGSSDPTIVVLCQAKRKGGSPRVVWAAYLKAVSFELSPFERAALEAVQATSAMGPA